MKIAEFSVKHSLFINLSSVFILIAGLFTLLNMNREAFPNVSFDRVTVQTVYPGSTSLDVEKLITTPIEKEIRKVSGIEEMTSSSADNLSLIIIKLDPDAKDKPKIVNDIQKAVDRVDDLPEDAKDPLVTELTTDEMPVIEVSLSGDITEEELQGYAEILEDRFLDIEGVSSVARRGWRNPKMWVNVNPHLLKEYYVSMEEIMAALRNRNITVPAGKLKTSTSEFNIRTTGEFFTKEEVENVIIRANDAGNWLRVKDVAAVEYSFEEEDKIFRTLGTRAVNLVIIKRLNGDSIDIVNDIKDIVKDFKKTASSELNITYVDDLSYFIRRRLNVLRNNGIIGFILVLASLLIFLNTKTAIFTALGIPISFFAAFMVMSYFGISINLLSMFGLIIVLGMLVDDGIIISENVFKYVESGMGPREAAIKGTQEVMKPVTATILTTIAAFSTLFFMTGIMGKFIRVIPIVVIIALLASLMEAFIILPSHLADFIKPKKRAIKEKKWYKKLLNFYTTFLNRALNKRYKVISIFAGILVIALLLGIFVLRFILFPSGGTEIFFLRAEAEVGTPLKKTSELMAPLEKLVFSLPKEELDTFITEVGVMQQERSMDASVRKSSHVGQIIVYLTPESKRRRDAHQIVEDLREKSKGIKGFEKVYFEMLKHGPPGGKPVDVKIKGEDFSTLKKISSQIKAFLSNTEGVRDISDDFELGKDEIIVHVDADKAKRAYLDIGTVASSVRNAFEGGIATSIKRSKAEEEIDVAVRFSDDARGNIDAFNKLLIPNKFGNLIELKEIASIEKTKSITSIKHLDGKRVIAVYAEIDEKKNTSLKVNNLLKKRFKDISQKHPGVHLKYGGEQEETLKSIKSLLRAFLLALFIIFMILATNFNSLVQPFIVMTAIPFGLIGVIIAFLFHGLPLSFMALLGIIGLLGIVVNDSIVLVEFINRLRLQGLSRRDSIVKAGQMRLRQVLLTTISTVFGLAPTAYGIAGSDPFIKPMALAITWGLVFSTILTLVGIPCIYAIVDDITLLLAEHPTVKTREQGFDSSNHI